MDDFTPLRRPSVARLLNWLEATHNSTPSKRYEHVLFVENDTERENVITSLTAYVVAAHEPARRRFRRLAGHPLHPLGPQGNLVDPAEGYPQNLALTNLKGYFGEIIAGMIVEKSSFFGSSAWEIPSFLFHTHDLAFQQIGAARETSTEVPPIPGQPGEDCLAFERDTSGAILKVIFIESKCTASHTIALIDEAHSKLSSSIMRPVSLLSLIEVLMEYEHDVDVQSWIGAIRQFYHGGVTPTRLDLSSYACGQHPVRNTTWITADRPHRTYSGCRLLTAIELHLDDVDALVSRIYGRPD